MRDKFNIVSNSIFLGLMVLLFVMFAFGAFPLELLFTLYFCLAITFVGIVHRRRNHEEVSFYIEDLNQNIELEKISMLRKELKSTLDTFKGILKENKKIVRDLNS